MQPVPLQLLQAFLVFGESENIGEAARRLGLSQPGLSKQLQRLEDIFPTEVFTFQGRKKKLTPYGEDLHRKLKAKIGSVQELIQQVNVAHSSAENALLRITARQGVLDRIAGVKFRGSLHFLDRSNEAVIDSLLGLKAEIGITHAIPDAHEIVAKPLFREEFRLMLPKRNFPRQPAVNRELLLRLKIMPCMAYKPEDALLQGIFLFHSVDPYGLRPFRAAENYSVLASMMRSGAGWGLLPAYLGGRVGNYWSIPLPANVVPPRNFYLLYRKEFSGIAWFKELLAEIRGCF